MKVFLIGFMGCGKTTLGKKLASKLSFTFVDLDKEIETDVGMSIPEYFSKFGEDGFRRKESEVLKTTPFPENSVIATGGGAPCFFDNMDWMNLNGITVYLSLSPKALASRLESASEERPLIKNLKGDDLVNFISSKLADRDLFYSKALVKVEGITNHTPENLSLILADYLK